MEEMKVVVEEELKKGWEATSQLQSLLARIEGDIRSSNDEFEKERILSFSENYCETIIKSFDTCLSILKEASNVQVTSYNRDSPNTHALGKIGQNMTLKSKHPRVKTIETPNLVPDHYLWRKYGQKPILHSRHPREYYRCAYKDDQQCQATKHVQKILDNPPKYKITYYSEHTCNPDLLSNNVAQANHILDFEKNDCTNLISFESKTPTKAPKQVLRQELVLNSSPPFLQGNNVLSMAPLAHNDHGPSTSNNVDSREILEPSLASRDQTNVVYSPDMMMSPTYMANSSLQVEDYVLTTTIDETYFEMNGALDIQDLSLWEDEVIPYNHID